MGCYPLFVCQNWSRLSHDLECLENRLVSVVLVTYPFGDYDLPTLQSTFPDVCFAFKEHFVADLRSSPDSFVSGHHRRNVRRAASQLEIDVCIDPSVHAQDWISLYNNLITRHNIRGISAFSPASLAAQLRIPGSVLFRAIYRGETVGMILWYLQETVAYYHLAAYSERGYELRASFPLFDSAIRYFARCADWLSLGAGAGTDSRASDGLTRFKSGWASGTRTAFLCGRVLDSERYAALVEARGARKESYFPAYRRIEF
jgi:hypothetical protein